MSKNINIDTDIIEKYYYVCTVLRELAENQDYLKAYFKGGTTSFTVSEPIELHTIEPLLYRYANEKERYNNIEDNNRKTKK